ncbi:unnamed protein product [Mytilus edulis]|uniref:Uncharacterized protein n=1 Tax=Mytilus edulis TaxID=6550 RepID=A0A8S3RJM6_MYTED|nr:unnamed protein product [Mytilus edulis]
MFTTSPMYNHRLTHRCNFKHNVQPIIIPTDQDPTDTITNRCRLEKCCRKERKTCENFPFFTLDDAEIRKATRTNSILYFQVNLLQTSQTQILKEKEKLESVVDLIKEQLKEKEKLESVVDLIKEQLKEKEKLESVVDLIKEQLKENRKSLRQEIDFLKQENRTLKSKLQKTISKSTELSREIEIRNLENDKLERTIRTLYIKISGLDVSELANQKKIKDLTTSCRKLETEINALRNDSCDCKIKNPTMSRPIQSKGQNVNHDPSRGRRRQYFY